MASSSSIPGLASVEQAGRENREGLADLTRVFFTTQSMSTRACGEDEGIQTSSTNKSAFDFGEGEPALTSTSSSSAIGCSTVL